MTCDSITLPDGTTIIACNRGKRWPRCQVAECTRPAPFLCDHAVTRVRGGPGTCDMKLCDYHRRPQAGTQQPDDPKKPLDYCPAHDAAVTQRAAGGAR